MCCVLFCVAREVTAVLVPSHHEAAMSMYFRVPLILVDSATWLHKCNDMLSLQTVIAHIMTHRYHEAVIKLTGASSHG
jgi:hypothetical protein